MYSVACMDEGDRQISMKYQQSYPDIDTRLRTSQGAPFSETSLLKSR